MLDLPAALAADQYTTEVPLMRHTKARTSSRNFTLIEVVALPQLVNLTQPKTGGRETELSMRKAGEKGQSSIIGVL
jgi:hypothetical protein